MRTPKRVRDISVTTVRLPREIAEQIRHIADGELERESVVLRRLLRYGLEVVRKHDVSATPAV